MRLHNLEAYVLLDSGCTMDSISPEFTMSVNLKAHELEEPVPLQLGTVGSRSKMNSGLFTDFKIGGLESSHYFDVLNIDRYNVILGTMFMRKHGIALDFEWDEVHIKSKHLKTVIKGLTPLCRPGRMPCVLNLQRMIDSMVAIWPLGRRKTWTKLFQVLLRHNHPL